MKFEATQSSQTKSVSDTLETLLSVECMKEARDLVFAVCAAIPALERLKITPQTFPHHGEGPMVIDHVIRMVAVLNGIQRGATFSQCEEMKHDDMIFLALLDAERAVRESPGVFLTYAFMHVAAKPDRLLLVAAPGTKGEAEGFVCLSKRVNPYSTKSELVRFDKLRRAGMAEGIVATYDNATRAVARPQYADLRDRIVQYFHLEGAFVKFLTELCWSHEDVAHFFIETGNDSAFVTFAARAGKAGLNVEKFLDALLVIVLIDHDFGRVTAQNDFMTFRRFVAAEHATMPERFATREARQRHRAKLRVKEIFAQCGLEPETLFQKLGVGVGKERGEIMHRVYAVIRGEADGSSFGIHASMIESAAHCVRERLAEEGLSV